MGYSTQIQSIFHNTEELKLSYEVDKEGIVYINSKGLITALTPGIVRIKATWTDSYNKTIYSNEIEIEVLDEILNEDKIDLKGYTIIHNYSKWDTGLKTSNYELDKLLYQFIVKLEKEYNFNLKYEDYPTSEIEKQDVKLWLFNDTDHLVVKDKINDITSLYKKYMNDFPYMLSEDKFYMNCYDNKVCYMPYFGFSQLQALYYSEKKIKELGLEDPFDLYLEGKWTYSNFISWCQKAKSILDATQKEEDKIYADYYYVLGGEERSLFYGLMTTVNKTTIDTITKEIQFDSKELLEIKELINNLTESDIYNSAYTYGHGRLLFVADSFTINELNYRRDEEIRMVPYPYPDNYNPEDVKFGQYLNCSDVVFPIEKTKDYPEGVEFEEVFEVVCKILNYEYLLNATTEEYKYDILMYVPNCGSDKHSSYYSKIPIEDYIFADPLFQKSEGWLFASMIINEYLYNENYKESEEYKEFLEFYERLYGVSQ